MIGAVVLLGASIILERSKVDCWQTSISAYYYTPVRAVFVGAMIAVGFALIVYKGRGAWEDAFLNLSGMLAPIVAVAPTTDVDVDRACWSTPPSPLPRNDDGSLATWVVRNIDNNVDALLYVAAVGLAVGAGIAAWVWTSRRRNEARGREWQKGTTASLAGVAAVVLITWIASRRWNDFDTKAHGIAAVLMFVFLILAIIAGVREREEFDRSAKVYLAIAIVMVIGGALIALTRAFGEHTVFALEAYEITLFAIYWVVQTVEKWDEQVRGQTAPVWGQSRA
jgi:hypothetical protein